MSMNNYLRFHLLTAATAALTLAAGLGGAPAMAGTVDLGTTPPDLSSAVNPNIIVTFDDSGSMGATALPDSMADDSGKKFYYDPTQNFVYFDPLKEYPPPLKPDGSSFPPSVYSAAWRDGICANWTPSYCSTGINTKDLRSKFHENFINLTATTNRPNSNTTSVAAIGTAIRPASGSGFWYNCPVKDSETGCVLKVVDPATDPMPNPLPPLVKTPIDVRFANWYSYYRTRNLMTRTALSRVFGGPTLDNKVRLIWQTINADFGGTPAIRSRQLQEMTGTWKTSFFNWMFEVTNNGSTPNRRATIEANKVAERALTTDNMNPYWYPPLVAGGSGRNLECRQNFHMLVTDGYWNEADNTFTLPSPFRKQSDSFTLPDGKAYPSSPWTTVYSNVAAPAMDSSLSNIAFHYWATDLQPTLANKVPAYWVDRTAAVAVPPANPGSVPEVYWKAANDPATWQHVVQFMVALGINGELKYSSDPLLSDFPSLVAGTKKWPAPVSNEASTIDDTWHASVNAHGEYLSAKDPAGLVEQLTTILTSILTRRGASTTPAVSTGVLTTTTAGYVAGYDSADWSGYLLGQKIDENGNLLPTVNWDAGCKLTGGPCPSMGLATNPPAVDPNLRVIVTSNGSLNSGKAFRWTSLSTTQQTALNGADTRGSDRLNYLRGVRTSEELTTGAMRKRGSVLGPVVNGQPRYYGPVETLYDDLWPAKLPDGVTPTPEMSTPFKPFSKYRTESLSRPERVFLAANDGMLHAFDKNGNEKWAYVPSTLFTNGKLRQLTLPNTGLVPTVDDRPIIGDAYIRGKWRSILIGSLRFGGRGIYALDVSDAASGTETESGVSSKLLWEFNALNQDGTTNAAAANLGYTYDSANLARLANGKWVVLVSSGYFPKTGPDSTIAPAIANQTSLFVIDLDTGTLIRELRTPATVTSYGLSGPEVVNYNRGRETNIDSFAVAGDLAGNLWRFNLEDPTPANWNVTLMFQTYNGVAADIGKQPISVTPIAFSDPGRPGKAILLFGTGKYLGDEDRLAAGTPQQYLYGIRDKGVGMPRVTQAQLLNQTMINEAGNRRSVTKTGLVEANEGWRVNLPTLGERNVVTLTPIFANGFAVYSTIIPAGDNPCEPARTGAIIVLDSRNGGPPGSLLDSAFGGTPSVGGYAGVVVSNPPAAGQLGAVNAVGGGRLVLPGITPVGGGDPVSLNVIPVWRRGSWREALDFTE